MASSHPTTTSSSTTFHHSPTYLSDPTTPNTTFVQADPSTFRTVVQKLTGASDNPSSPKLPLALPPRLAADIGPKKPTFKLHERRHAAKKMDLSIGVSQLPIFNLTKPGANSSPSPSSLSSSSPSPSFYARSRGSGFMGLGGETVMASPVSPLEILEERAIAEKGFFLHPGPLSMPRASKPPELLPLFPLHSPSHNNEPKTP